MKKKFTSSSLLWLPDKSSWLVGPGSKRLLLEEDTTILEEDDIMLEEGAIMLEGREVFDEVLFNEASSEISPAVAITTSLAMFSSEKRT